MRLEGKVAWISGAGSGIGRAMAERFAAEGAKVMVVDVDEPHVDDTVATIRGAGGEADRAIVDVRERRAVERSIDAAIERWGRLDILVNNAGVMDMMTPIVEVDDELWERVFAVNVDGPFYAMRYAIERMTAQRSGVILNIASIAGVRGARAGAAYTASKHALIGLTKNTAYMYAPDGIRCNVICPGGVDTAMGVGGVPNETGMGRSQLGFGTNLRSGKPGEIADVAVLLVSDESTFVNGASVVVDGGWTAY